MGSDCADPAAAHFKEADMLPTLFVSHGAPILPLTDVPARDFLQGLPGLLNERPTAILMISAHWETKVPTVNVVKINDTIYDFGGFDPALRQIHYTAPGSADLAARVGDLLTNAGLPTFADRQRGLDHGAWVPLFLMYPEADIPVVQLSIQSHLGPAHHLALGRAIADLRSEGVLVIGSGSYTHNLYEFRAHWRGEEEGDPAWVTAFADWFDEALLEGRTSDMLSYRRLAPQAERNHPTEEHLLPLFAAMGAAGEEPHIQHLHRSTTFGVLRMDVFAFGDQQP
jgi:4,5-DOPA dioxygenase extradiol